MNWERLARANTHPLRVSILEVLSIDGGRTLSPKDLSLELQAPLSTVNYHVTELRRSGLRRNRRANSQVRGAIEHFYRAVDSGGEARGGRGGARPSGRRAPTKQPAADGWPQAIEKRTTGLEPATSSLGSSRSTS